jgi:hypothetical protein
MRNDNDNDTYPHHHTQSFANILDDQSHHVTWVDASEMVSLSVDGATHMRISGTDLFTVIDLIPRQVRSSPNTEVVPIK